MTLAEKRTAGYARHRITTAREDIETLPPSREKALVLTKLDEALLWLEQLVREAAE